MLRNRIKQISISGGVLVIALVACGKAPTTPGVSLPIPSVTSLPLTSITAIQGTWTTPNEVTNWGSNYYIYKFGVVALNQITTLTIQHVCNVYGKTTPITVQISVPIQVIVPQLPYTSVTASQLIMRVASEQTAFNYLYGVNCTVTIARYDSPYIILGNSLVFNPTSVTPLRLTKTF